MRLIKDSRGVKSWHLTLAIPLLLLITTWFLVGGVDVQIAGLHITTSTKTGADYLLAITPWLTAMGARDWIEKVATKA